MRAFTCGLSAVLVAACNASSPPPYTVPDLVGDPALLQGILKRCEAGQQGAGHDAECSVAMRAVERIAAEEEKNRAGARGAAFEREREAHRAREEQRRGVGEQRPAFDPYTSPVATEAAPDSKKP